MLKKSLFSTTQFGFVFCVLEPLSEVRECSGGWDENCIRRISFEKVSCIGISGALNTGC